MRTLGLAATAEESREAPRNSHGDWTFLRPQERVPEVLIVIRELPQVCCRNSRNTRRFTPQREMRPLFHCSVPREIAPSLLSLKRVLETQGISRSSPTYPSPLARNPEVFSTTEEEPRFSALIPRGESISLIRWERNSPQKEAVST